MAHGYPDFEGDKSSIYSKPQWAAVEATDLNWLIADAVAAFGEFVSTTYNVPVGSTLYITHTAFSSHAVVAADGDNRHSVFAQIQDATTATALFVQAGDGGGYASFTKPLVIVGGHQFHMAVICYANHNCTIGMMVAGYVI